MVFKQFQYRQNDIVYVAKSGRFGLFGVMETAGPIDSDIGGLFIQFDRWGDGTAGRKLAKFVQTCNKNVEYFLLNIVEKDNFNQYFVENIRIR